MASEINTLEDIRRAIDALDHAIIKLIAERGLLVQRAVGFKRDRAEVQAPDRVAQVISKVRDHALAAGLAPEVAEETYRAMVGAFIDLELRSLYDRGNHSSDP